MNANEGNPAMTDPLRPLALLVTDAPLRSKPSAYSL